jgi:hypothetical protein
VKTDIFQTPVEMPPKGSSPDVVRTAMTPTEVRENYTPTGIPNKDMSVVNVQRPRRGHGY